jgi:hypothetical protein
MAEKQKEITKKQYFIKALAKFLVVDQVGKSISLQMGNSLAKEWAELRNATPVFGYPSLEEAEETLTEFLS